MPPSRLRIRLLIGMLLAVIPPVVISLALLPGFLHRLNPDPNPTPEAAIGVVFTGQFARIETGLSLLSQGRVSQLFISGVNSDAGTSTGRFPAQFRLDDNQIAALNRGQIALGTRAESTLQNALETACWLRAQDGMTLVLITARGHMPRASRALEALLPATSRPVSRLTAGPDQSLQRLWLHEFPRYVLMRMILLLPEGLLRRVTGLECVD